MPMLEDMPTSETLVGNELEVITGYKMPAKQRTWLDQNGWKYHRNRAGHPVVGRAYARLKMAGITPTKGTAKETWSMDLSKVS
ncbi:protein of unknown function [Azotobacter beijerinckii]|uniref:DUF4224 domain-containing protein n=1 Tax=Azotobacter beijerinckii TaxID=170623 RepID=A0A1H9JRK2_9GAMM|nr:DUF4224 domain-containing protein [Azotobacter beijerinckii]SEI91384.1 protein of unknown function [Azotobacter beijerinckii]SEQ89601.1 protein of unknown function [Azotobacter beijerinckii]